VENCIYISLSPVREEMLKTEKESARETKNKNKEKRKKKKRHRLYGESERVMG
jgi:hypothetical protein